MGTTKMRDVTPEAMELAARNMHEIDDTYGDNLPYDANRLVGEVRFYLNQGALAMLQAGKRLILLKEHEARGQFMKYVEENIGISQDTAHNMMRAARKFLGQDDKPNSELVRNLGSVTKLYELAMMDDEDLEALEEGGTLAGKTLDDIQRMSPTELRTTLREERERRREDLITHSRLLEEKNQKIDELSEKLLRVQNPSGWTAEAQQLSGEIEVVWMKAADIQAKIVHLAGRIRELETTDWDGSQYQLNKKLEEVVKELLQSTAETQQSLEGNYIPNKATYQIESARQNFDRQKAIRSLLCVDDGADPDDPPFIMVEKGKHI